ncbi:MAG: histidine phosphatase family protein [Bdellovibrionales bacterium]|nr:histidine phosphatase family protein [Bdellovibrionales bacterium]
MKLFIVRHGETISNVGKVIAGQSESQLTDLGKEQARLLARRLSKHSFTHIYSSPLSRASETTKYIGEHQSSQPVYLDQLKERSWGCFEGRLIREYVDAAHEYGERYWEFTPPGGESLVDLQERIAPALTALLEKHKNEKVLISAHHSVNKMLLHILLERTWEDWGAQMQGNTCVNSVEVISGFTEVRYLNCCKHLIAL